MIKPRKHMNLNLSVLKISSLILKDLMKKGIIKYDDLYNKLYKKIGDDLFYIFPLALSFLYLQNTIEYHSINDSFEYLSRREHVEVK